MMNGALGRGCRWALLAAAVTCVCMSFPSEVWSASEEAPLVEVAPVEIGRAHV